MIIEFEINGARVIVTGENLTVSVSEDSNEVRVVPQSGKSETSGIRSPAQIKLLRKSLRLNQTQFAELFGVGQPTVSRWERGIEKPNGSAVLLLMPLFEQQKVSA